MDIPKDFQVVPLPSKGPDYFVAKSKPRRMGNAGKIAYGGFQLAQGSYAACSTVQADYFVYSLHAIFLGPSLMDHCLEFKVERTRDTRSFATRRVEVFQQQGASLRKTMVLTIDFHVREAALMSFSSPPLHKYTHFSQLPPYMQLMESQVKEGKTAEKLLLAFRRIFPLLNNGFDIRYCPEATGTAKWLGLKKKAESPQASLPLHERTNAVWSKITNSRCTSHAEQIAALAFYMDAALAFSPLTFTSRFLDDASACATLEASLRVFTPDLDLNQWHLQEQRTSAGGFGRTFNFAQMWQEDGQLVANMSQQCILRPLEDPKAKL